MDEKYRILIVDDNKSVHDDFKKIVCQPGQADKGISDLEEILFDKEAAVSPGDVSFSIDDAFQGEEAVAMVDRSQSEGKPYIVVFIDMRMPPGIDGIETIGRIWGKYPALDMVICTAYSDYSREEIVKKLGTEEHLQFLFKPFSSSEVKDITSSIVKRKSTFQ